MRCALQCIRAATQGAGHQLHLCHRCHKRPHVPPAPTVQANVGCSNGGDCMTWLAPGVTDTVLDMGTVFHELGASVWLVVVRAGCGGSSREVEGRGAGTWKGQVRGVVLIRLA